LLALQLAVLGFISATGIPDRLSSRQDCQFGLGKLIQSLSRCREYKN
jgi:hypothetical protein